MQQYNLLKEQQGAGFEEQLSSRDSAINAQAAEIQRLINELNAAKRRSSSTPAATSDESARIERLQKEIREKESTISKLQRQIEQQTKQIAELNKTSQSGAQSDASQQKQIAKLQSRIDEQQKQIADLQNDVKRLREESNTATKNSEKMKKDYESQLASVNKQLNSCNSEKEQLNAQIKAKDAEIQRIGKSDSAPDYSAELKQLRAQVDDLNKKEAACRKQYEETLAQLNAVSSNSSRNEADKSELQKQINDLNKLVDNYQKSINDLQKRNDELVRAANRNDGSQTVTQKTVYELDAQVAAQREQIAELQAELAQKDKELEAYKKSGSSNAPTASTVNKKLEELQNQCESYLAEIERLRAENERLKYENNELRERVASSADLYAENERLQQKVKLASVLVTDDLKVTPGKSIQTGNIVKSTTKAKQVKVVRIDCRILDNNVVDPGSITIYARIANAANRVVANGQAESFDLSGTPMQYTMKQDIEFTGYGRNLAMIWKKSDDVEMAPGLYWLTLYAGGYEIGKVSFKLD
jgi:chromosome segregation ATPase